MRVHIRDSDSDLSINFLWLLFATFIGAANRDVNKFVFDFLRTLSTSIRLLHRLLVDVDGAAEEV